MALMDKTAFPAANEDRKKHVQTVPEKSRIFVQSKIASFLLIRKLGGRNIGLKM